MQNTNRLRHRIPTIRRYAQELQLWVLGLLTWVASWGEGILKPETLRQLRGYLREDMATARYDIRRVLFTFIVAHQFIGKRGKRYTSRPFATPVGFRYVARDIDILRIYLRGIPLKTLDDMRHALDNLDAVVAKALKRLPKNGVDFCRIACIAPPVATLTPAIPAPAPEAADTS